LDYGANESGVYLIKRENKIVGNGADATTVLVERRIFLTNFLAVIKEQRIIDDGDGDDMLLREYIIEAATSSAGNRFTLPADQFYDMRRWVDKYVGAPATLLPNVHNHIDHASAAIKLLSGTPPTLHIRTHTGWAEAAGVMGFLHQAGMIGPTIPGQAGAVAPAAQHGEWPITTQCSGDTSGSSGPFGPFSGLGHGRNSYQTDLPTQLRKFDLPDPLVGDDLKAGFEAVYELV